jgi:hypothetical protein
VDYLFGVVAGCRYRLTVERDTLPRVLVEVGPPGAVALRADDGDAAGEGEEADAPVVLTWYAELDGAYEARIRGFSAGTGRGRLRLETIGPDGRHVAAHRRILAPGNTLAQVGDLVIGFPNRWDLVVEPGRTYEVVTLPGTAGRIAYAVKDAEGVLAEALPRPGAPYPSLRFTVPASDGGAGAPGLRLEVRGMDSGGGTYGVRLTADPPARREGEGDPPEELPRERLDDVPLGFTANAGDVAVLFLPNSSPYNTHPLFMEREGAWTRLPGDAITVHGARGSMRTPENAALVWFRPYAAGAYRFSEPDARQAVLEIYPADDVQGAPLLLGTDLDPSVRARGGSRWRAIGLGVCMPGWDYLFVAVGNRVRRLGMRVRDLDGGTVARRSNDPFLQTEVAGMGPSLRFRVRAPMLVRLELSGRGWEGYALLRRASN